jgi:hypothetical protein
VKFVGHRVAWGAIPSKDIIHITDKLYQIVAMVVDEHVWCGSIMANVGEACEDPHCTECEWLKLAKTTLAKARGEEIR